MELCLCYLLWKRRIVEKTMNRLWVFMRPTIIKLCMVEWYNQKIQCSHMVTLCGILWHPQQHKMQVKILHFSGESFQWHRVKCTETERYWPPIVISNSIWANDYGYHHIAFRKYCRVVTNAHLHFHYTDTIAASYNLDSIMLWVAPLICGH